jgi:hypothetical protein
MTTRYRIRLVEIKLNLFVEILGTDLKLAILARPNTHEHRQIERGRHDKTIVVIGVFANQVDAARRAKSARRIIDECL